MDEEIVSSCGCVFCDLGLEHSTWRWAKNLRGAILEYEKGVDEISFDHDLGPLLSFDSPLPLNQTTMPLAKIIEERAEMGVKPPKWSVHSMNPVGKANLIAALESADKLYARKGEN